MTAVRGIKQFNKAVEKIEQQKLWEFYCSVYVHMKEKKPFHEYYSQARTKVKKPKSKLTNEEIIEMAEKIRIRHVMLKAKQKENR